MKLYMINENNFIKLDLAKHLAILEKYHSFFTIKPRKGIIK
jgi:hypothetical protein